MAMCDHKIKRMKILGEMECAECVLVRLAQPLRKLCRLLDEVTEEAALETIKRDYNLTDKDILLAGWVWQEWKKRTGN